MAILIPSKNIYAYKNPKVRDNVINNVSVEQAIVEQSYDYETTVFNEQIRDFIATSTNSDPENKDISIATNSKVYSLMGAGTVTYGVGSYCAFNSYKKTPIFSIKIQKIKNNTYIDKLYYGINEEGTPNIKYSLIGYLKTGTASATFHYNLPVLSTNLNLETSAITYGSSQEGNEIRTQIPKKGTYTHSGTYVNDTIYATSEATFYNNASILTAEPIDYTDENGIDYYVLYFYAIAGWRVVKMGGYQVVVVGGNGDFPMSGTYEEFVPTQIEITIYGNTIKIDLKNHSVSYIKDNNGNIVEGNGENPFTLDSNELLQTSGTIGDKPISQHLGDNALSQYHNGKETATLRCDISDYFEYDPRAIGFKGDKVISINSSNQMSFQLHDQVIPMVADADGTEKPMSRNADGNPKIFEVTGVNFIYDGAVWQELSLQECN